LAVLQVQTKLLLLSALNPAPVNSPWPRAHYLARRPLAYHSSQKPTVYIHQL